MRWKDLSIGKKLGLGFGGVLSLLGVISIFSFVTFKTVGQQAHITENLANQNQFILEKTIDHLGWVAKLSDLVFNEEVHKIELETDDHNCGFGKWLYGEETKMLAAQDEHLATLLEKIKAPHNALHQSAVKIMAEYVPFDRSLDTLLAERWNDHLLWIKNLSHSLLTGEKFSGGLDPTACAFGKWYHNYQAADPEFGRLLKAWEEPHQRLHASAQKIVALMADGTLDAAREIYQKETLKTLDQLAMAYQSTMSWIDSSVTRVVATRDIFQSETMPALATTREVLNEIRAHYKEQNETADQMMQTAISGAVRNNLALALAALAIGVVAAVFIARGISVPIAKGVSFAQALSSGDLTRTMEVHQKDEIGILANALNTMAINLRQMFTEITGGVQTISSSSTELSAISEQMAANAEQTSGKSNQVAAAAEEMSANMSSVAAASEQASSNIQMVASSSEEMSATISEIAGSTEKGRHITEKAVVLAQTVSARVAQLGKSAFDIGKVTETINEISEQTNLLALNATIEAARAGEAGKGFAVVANEIKELARQTAMATQDIRGKIDGIQSSTNGTVKEIDQIEEVINEINSIVATIATALEEQSVSTQEVAGNVSQAAQGIHNVNENVAQSSVVSDAIAQDVVEVNQAAREMADGSAQVKASAHELSSLAEQLTAMVARFRV